MTSDGSQVIPMIPKPWAQRQFIEIRRQFGALRDRMDRFEAEYEKAPSLMRSATVKAECGAVRSLCESAAAHVRWVIDELPEEESGKV